MPWLVYQRDSSGLVVKGWLVGDFVLGSIAITPLVERNANIGRNQQGDAKDKHLFCSVCCISINHKYNDFALASQQRELITNCRGRC